jgi:hypothetical protein
MQSHSIYFIKILLKNYALPGVLLIPVSGVDFLNCGLDDNDLADEDDEEEDDELDVELDEVLDVVEEEDCD